MACPDPEVERVISFAKYMRSRGVPGYDVENEHLRCGTLRVYMGFSQKDGRQIVLEFDMSRAFERTFTGPADVLSGCPIKPHCAPGWKAGRNGGIEWF